MDFGAIITVLVAALCGAIAGFFGGTIVSYLYSRASIASLEAQIVSMRMRAQQPDAVQARKDKAERMSSAMTEVLIGIKAEGAKPEEVIKAVAAKYPDVALDVVKKGMKGKLPGGIEDMF